MTFSNRALALPHLVLVAAAFAGCLSSWMETPQEQGTASGATCIGKAFSFTIERISVHAANTTLNVTLRSGSQELGATFNTADIAVVAVDAELIAKAEPRYEWRVPANDELSLGVDLQHSSPARWMTISFFAGVREESHFQTTKLTCDWSALEWEGRIA